jgi:hypothetical protein
MTMNIDRQQMSVLGGEDDSKVRKRVLKVVERMKMAAMSKGNAGDWSSADSLQKWAREVESAARGK